ncbi:hypothetical protein [Leptolyngbya sp. O-77]|uniref:hypothetical protein n=1 Tax=Leptolyngbya sp. O-77 TaxID=1080068 RepID=UPI0012E3E6BF|nr:hypothetical protein [Leptolyngbya sp. O-77]
MKLTSIAGRTNPMLPGISRERYPQRRSSKGISPCNYSNYEFWKKLMTSATGQPVGGTPNNLANSSKKRGVA